MKVLATACVALFFVASGSGQIFSTSRDRMIEYTKQNPYGRFPDGRPKVPDSILERVKTLSVEEAWGVLRNKGYMNQYEGDFEILKPGERLVGRALTAKYLPLRPDLEEAVEADRKAKGLARGVTQRVVDALQKGDVPVVDVLGAAPGHNFGGDNMLAAVYGATGIGAVVHGTIRDLQGVAELPLQVYFRKAHPAAVSGVSLVGLNIPVSIGNAVVLPGDVVFGDRTGVVFIPPHLVEEIVGRAEEIHIKDEWTKAKLITGKYRPSDLYPRPQDPALIQEYEEYKKKRLAEIEKERGK